MSLSAPLADPDHAAGEDTGGPMQIRRFGLAFAAAALGAIGVALLLPPARVPQGTRFAATMRPVQDHATAALERAAEANPDDPEALRRLAQHLRGSHRPLQLAVTLERLHGLTGAPMPLREAMRLRMELGDATAARRALEQLSLIGATTDQEALQLAGMRIEAGDAAGAFAGLLAATGRSPTAELALRSMQAAARLPEPARAMRPLGALLAGAAPDVLEALRRVLMKDGRPDLAASLLEGLPPERQARPDMAFAMAQAESRAGWAGSALTRLLALRATEGLPGGAGALLIDLALRQGQVEEAFEVAARLPADAWPADLPMRLYQAARAAGQPALVRRIDPQRLAVRPDAAALVALARGDRAAAGRFAQQALDSPPASVEGARGVAAVLRELGQDQAAHDRLRRQVQGDNPNPAAIRLFAEIAAPPARRPAALALLERLRGGGPVAGEAWLRLALAENRLADAARFLRGGGTASPAALAETLTLAAQRRDPALADAAAALLRRAAAPPEGWTAEEVSATALLARPLTPGSLAAALNLLDWAGDQAARDRVVRLLAATPEISSAATSARAAQHPAIPRLKREAETADEAGIAHLALLAVLAPLDAAPLLAQRAAEDPARFGAALVLARLRGEGAAEGQAALDALLPKLAEAQQEQVLFLVLAAAPADSLDRLRQRADQVLGAGWQGRYEAALTRQGRRAELLAALRARAARAEPSEREEIAARMAELGDPEGAEAVRNGEAEGMD